jgi:hypothetical protein
MKTYGGVDVEIHIFLTSALVGDEWSVSRTYRFTPGKEPPVTHFIGGWVDPRAGLDGTKDTTMNSLSRYFVLWSLYIQ